MRGSNEKISDKMKFKRLKCGAHGRAIGNAETRDAGGKA
jgi:hypothetical protein